MSSRSFALFSSFLGGHFRRSKLKSKSKDIVIQDGKPKWEKTPRNNEKGENITMRPKMKYTSDFSNFPLPDEITQRHSVAMARISNIPHAMAQSYVLPFQ